MTEVKMHIGEDGAPDEEWLHPLLVYHEARVQPVLDELGPDGRRTPLGYLDPRHTLFNRRISWATPDLNSVMFLARELRDRGLVLEVGAGHGFLASIMSQVLQWRSSDTFTTHGSSEEHTFTRVVRERALRSVQQHPEAGVLVSVWPSWKKGFAADALQEFTLRVRERSRFVLWGEERGGCTGNDELFDLLDQHYELVAEHQPLTWYGVHDMVMVYRPRPAAVEAARLFASQAECEQLPATVDPARVCALPDCDRDSELRLCGRCRQAQYCSRAHQREHWPMHKVGCRSRVP